MRLRNVLDNHDVVSSCSLSQAPTFDQHPTLLTRLSGFHRREMTEEEEPDFPPTPHSPERPLKNDGTHPDQGPGTYTAILPDKCAPPPM